MQVAVAFLVGVLVGALVMRWVMHAGQREAGMPSAHDEHYLPARRAVARYLHAHGTLNVAQLEQLLSVNGTVALRCLEAMVREGMLQHHERGPGKTFYTRA
jgi:uncharacterized oligopeptide transporter (OPT) family protein